VPSVTDVTVVKTGLPILVDLPLIGKLFGLVGLIVAVPILPFLMVLTRHILLGEVYGDPISEVKLSGVIPPEAEPTVTAQAAIPSQPAIP
jgi:hypothetical protein